VKKKAKIRMGYVLNRSIKAIKYQHPLNILQQERKEKMVDE